MDEKFPSFCRPSRWSRRLFWLRRVGISILLLLAIYAATDFYLYRAAIRKLNEATGKLDETDPGWRLADIEAARQSVPDELSSAPTIRAVAEAVPDRWASENMDTMLAEYVPPHGVTQERLVELGAALKKYHASVVEARRLAALPAARFPLTYERNTLETRIPHIQWVRQVCSLLAFDAFFEAQSGRSAMALVASKASFNAARAIGDEPFLVSQLVRTAGIVSACRSVEWTLALGEPGIRDLWELQGMLEAEDMYPGLLVGFRGERAATHELFDALECDDLRPSQFAGNKNTPPTLTETLLGWRIRHNFRREHPIFLELMTEQVEDCRRPLHEQKGGEWFNARVRALPSDAVISRLMLPALGKTATAIRRKHAIVRSLAAGLAAERYRQRAKAWPVSLEVLVPEYLKVVPLDPYDGEKLRFLRLEDGIVIYAVGMDRSDDGGTFDKKNPDRDGADIGYRIWDVAKRRQPPRPPAPPSE